MTEGELTEKAERFYRLARYSGMPEITGKTMLLTNFLQVKGTEKAYKAALNFVTEKCEHHFIAFIGEPGRGKTHLAIGIGWQWLGQDKGIVKYWQVSELLDAMRSEYDNPPRSEYGFPLLGEFEKCKSADLLILDDLGVEKISEWVADKLDTLINHRWLEQKPTVFTTNLKPQQLQPRIKSRIKEGVTVTLDGLDYREIKAKERE